MKPWQIVILLFALLYSGATTIYVVSERSAIETEQIEISKREEAAAKLADLCGLKWPLRGERYDACLNGLDVYFGQRLKRDDI